MYPRESVTVPRPMIPSIGVIPVRGDHVWTGALLLALSLTTSEGCSKPTPPGAGTHEQAMQGAAVFAPTTYEELSPYAPADRLIAVVRCEEVAVAAQGSRSERQDVRGVLLAGRGQQGSTVLLRRYAQGPAIMALGSTYLVAMYRETASGPWTLVEHRRIEATAAQPELERAEAEAASRLSGQPDGR